MNFHNEIKSAVSAPQLLNIPDQLETNSHLMTRLDDELMRLEARITSVTIQRPANPTAGPSQEDHPLRSSLAETLASRNYHLRQMIERVENLANSVDL
jgi:hypothetical protein